MLSRVAGIILALIVLMRCPDARTWKDIHFSVRNTRVFTTAEVVDVAHRVGVNLIPVVRVSVERVAKALGESPPAMYVNLGTGSDPAGVTQDWSGTVLVLVDPSMPRSEMLPLLRWTIAHESFHSAQRTFDAKAFVTLGGHAVYEGKAEAFARSLYPKYPEARWDDMPWSLKSCIWRRWRNHLNDAWSPHLRHGEIGCLRRARLLHGINRLRYSMGYQIVADYLSKNPKIEASGLVRIPAAEVLAAAG